MVTLTVFIVLNLIKKDVFQDKFDSNLNLMGI